MIINSLKLKNIRSYLEEEVNFPEGSTILSGDIGTGKTTILLAIEFALFGISRGQLSGTTMLRHGKKEGFVELSFSIEGKNVTIKRTLKRTSNSVTQDSGYIVMDGSKQDLTPVELKTKIIELLGYPEELVTKSKTLIYRYTVYTPQEEMKHILYESEDDRLNALRRIFDIDKYKRIKENTLNSLRELKTKRTELQTRIEDLEDKKKELKEYKENIETLSKKTEELEENIKELKTQAEEKETRVKQYEDNIKKIEKLKNNLELKQSEAKNKKNKYSENKEELENLQTRKEKLSEETEGFEADKFEELKEQKKEIRDEVDSIDENLGKIRERESKFKTIKENSQNIIDKIFSMDKCPTCDRIVKEGHKKEVKEREENKISKLDKNLEKLSRLKEQRIKKKESLKEKLEFIDEKLKNFEALKVKAEQLKEVTQRINKLQEQQKELKGSFEKLSSELKELKENLEGQPDIKEKYEAAKKKHKEVAEKLNKAEIEKAELVQKNKTINEVKDKLKAEIEKKKESKKKLEHVQELITWLNKYFLNIVYLMEKHIMLQIYQEFNEYFQEWFRILIEDENINVRLSETFTPIIEQNGYETFLENLSGGERTSVALAYRLALNKVINNFIGTIRTKDLLILDEPTDGFSSEQLDKIRDLLDRLDNRQVIIVSHEAKLESYVEHIVRVHKEEHTSRVISS